MRQWVAEELPLVGFGRWAEKFRATPCRGYCAAVAAAAAVAPLFGRMAVASMLRRCCCCCYRADQFVAVEILCCLGGWWLGWLVCWRRLAVVSGSRRVGAVPIRRIRGQRRDLAPVLVLGSL